MFYISSPGIAGAFLEMESKSSKRTSSFFLDLSLISPSRSSFSMYPSSFTGGKYFVSMGDESCGMMGGLLLRINSHLIPLNQACFLISHAPCLAPKRFWGSCLRSSLMRSLHVFDTGARLLWSGNCSSPMRMCPNVSSWDFPLNGVVPYYNKINKNK